VTTSIDTDKPYQRIPKPKWLRVKLPTGENYKKVRGLVDEHKLHTICESGNCPEAADPFEPARVAKSIKLMQVKHAVITSVDRDDLSDGGAQIWFDTVAAVRRISPGTTMETLIPDFAGKWENLQRIIDAAPEIVSHNLETVRRLTKQVRIQAKYDRSLEVLMRLKKGGMRTKSGVMLGLGETEQEVLETIEDLASVGTDILTLGQYLQPTPKHLPVKEFVTPEKFAEYKEIALSKGFRYVESGPLVRSSYHAEKHLF
jgi:lipoic acid synthetase